MSLWNEAIRLMTGIPNFSQNMGADRKRAPRGVKRAEHAPMHIRHRAGSCPSFPHLNVRRRAPSMVILRVSENSRKDADALCAKLKAAGLAQERDRCVRMEVLVST